MSKYTDPKRGKIYLLTTVKSNGKKRAYTLYDKNIINDYTLKKIIDHLPTNNNIDVETIRKDYYKIAL